MSTAMISASTEACRPIWKRATLFERTRHPCRLDFERFGIEIGLVKKRIDRILDRYTSFPRRRTTACRQQLPPPKLKRTYVRIVNGA